MRPEQRIDGFLKILGKQWKEQGTDLRFTQFLFNNGLVSTDADYHVEEWELLQRMFPNLQMREYVLWGTFGKTGKSKLKYILIKDLETDHIKNILKDVKRIKGTAWEKLFKKELTLRCKNSTANN